MYRCEYLGFYTWRMHMISETNDHPVILIDGMIFIRIIIDSNFKWLNSSLQINILTNLWQALYNQKIEMTYILKNIFFLLLPDYQWR